MEKPLDLEEEFKNAEIQPFSLEVPLGYGFTILKKQEIAEDVSNCGYKEHDLVLTYYLLDEKLNTKPGEPVPQKILDNLDNLNSVHLVISKDYAKDLIKTLKEYIKA